jgi:twinkle protein
MLHERHIQWIETRGISLELASKFGLFTKNAGGKNWLAVPYLEGGQVINHKYRLTSEKDHRMDGGQPLTLWNLDCLAEKPEDLPLVITEGEWDALALIQAGYPWSVSVPNGSASRTDQDEPIAYLWRCREQLKSVSRFILATDSDEAGRILAADLARQLGPERCSSVIYPEGCKDLNEVLLNHGSKAALEVVTCAKPYPIRGLYRFEDFPDPPPVQSLSCHIPLLDDLFMLTPGTFSVITGWAGHGKTSILCCMLANLLKQGVSMALGSFETIPRPILQRRMRSVLYNVPESAPEVNRQGPADDLLARKFGIISHSPSDDETELSIEYIIDLAKIAVMRDGIRLLILDPWNEIEHKRQNGETETEYASRAIRMLKRFAKNYECAVWLVAHPRKPSSDGSPKPPSLYDLAGSAHFANKADYGVVVHRDDLGGTEISVTVCKVRMGLPGRVGKVILDYDEQTASYVDPNARAMIEAFKERKLA